MGKNLCKPFARANGCGRSQCGPNRELSPLKCWELFRERNENTISIGCSHWPPFVSLNTAAHGSVFFSSKNLAAPGMENPVRHKFLNGLARLKSWVQLNQRIWPQGARLEATVHEFFKARLRNRDKARNVSAVILNDLIAKAENVHNGKESLFPAFSDNGEILIHSQPAETPAKKLIVPTIFF
jgi:hypothetical protein